MKKNRKLIFSILYIINLCILIIPFIIGVIQSIIQHEFKNIIQKTLRIGILSPSKKDLKNNIKFLSEDPLTYDCFFMTINPYQLKAMVDAVFGSL